MKPIFHVETDIPYGNVCDVSIVDDGNISAISFAADPHGGPECLWFCFRVARDASNVSGRRVRLILKHSQNMLGGGLPENMRPVLRRDGEDWQRLGAPSVVELPDGRKVVSWEVDAPETFFDFAYCYPYGMPEVDALLAETNGYWQRDTFGVSPQGRPMVRLCNDYGRKGNARPGLYLLARQHSGETPGSWMLDGFLRRIAELGDEAPLVWAAPLTNIDGVENGDYDKDNFPYDLNRAWGRVPMRHETRILQDDIRRWAQRCRPVLAMDFHAPGACEPNGIYSFVPSPDRELVHHRAVCEWAEVVREALSPEYAKQDEFARVANYPSRWETPRVGSYFWEFHGVPSLTLEIPYALAGELVFTREEYQQAGWRTADAIARRLGE